MGKRKKKGTEEADEMYEVDHIVASRLVKGAPRRQSTSFAGRATAPKAIRGSELATCKAAQRSSQTMKNGEAISGVERDET